MPPEQPMPRTALTMATAYEQRKTKPETGGPRMSTTTTDLLPQPAASQSRATGIPSFLELEITGFCQLKCVHCYAESGPHGGRGTMTTGDWERVIDQAAAIGVEMVQFIGGEPTLAPGLPRLVCYALGKGLKVYVYSNLVHVTPPLWDLFSQPGMSLGTSWYSADPGTHAEITGSRASYARTRASIAEAIRRGIPVRAAIVEIVKNQGIEQAAAELRRMGVTDIRIRRAQGVGRAAGGGSAHDVSELCGNCGVDRAAVLPDGQLTPCVVGRWLACGNVHETPLAQILSGPAWRHTMTLVPRHAEGQQSCPPASTCPPASDGNDCPPATCQ
jgi:sulfatase maturation enzyme AslB (radical SAM superfamily)